MARQKKNRADDSAPERTEQELAEIRAAKQREKRERFLRLAPVRVTNAIRRLGLIEACANKQSYVYHPEEAQAILEALTDALSRVHAAFEEREPEKREFTLPTLEGAEG